MRSIIRITGLFILAVALGVILAPQVYSLAQQTGSAFQGQAGGLVAQMQNYINTLSPNAAAYVATILAGGVAVAAALFAYILLFVPIRIHSMQRQIRRQGEQIESLKREIHLSSELFLDARKNYRAQHENEKVHTEARSRLRDFILPKHQEHKAHG